MQKITMKEMKLTRVLLVVLVMMLIINPVYAATKNSITVVPNVREDDTLTGTSVPYVKIEEYAAGEFGDQPQTFRLVLSNAQWIEDVNTIASNTETSGGNNPQVVNITRLTDTIIQLTIQAEEAGTSPAIWRIPLYSTMGTPGYASVSVDSRGSSVTKDTFPYAFIIGERESAGISVDIEKRIRTETAEEGYRVTEQDAVFLVLEENQANALSRSTLKLEVALTNARWFSDRGSGLNLSDMESQVEVEGSEEVEVTDISRINDRRIEVTIKGYEFSPDPATIRIPLYFEITETAEVRASVSDDDQTYEFSLVEAPEIPVEPEITEITFNVGQMGYREEGTWILSDVAPYIQTTADGLGRIMVPVKFVAVATGADEVVWDAVNRKVTVFRGETVVEMMIGSNVLVVNGELRLMDAVAEIQEIGSGLGRTMLPVAHLAQALEVEYEWNGADRSVTFLVVEE